MYTAPDDTSIETKENVKDMLTNDGNFIIHINSVTKNNTEPSRLDPPHFQDTGYTYRADTIQSPRTPTP